jgi:ribonuclease P protein component
MAGRPMGEQGPKRRRLTRSADFERVYRHGRSRANRALVLYAFPRQDAASARPETGPVGGRRPRRELPPRADEDAQDPDAGASGPRFGLSVSRRVGGAVERNRVKRVLREAFWAEAARLPADFDYVVVARPDARSVAEREGLSGMRGALAELIDALGGRGTPAGAGEPAPSSLGGGAESAVRPDGTDRAGDGGREASEVE